MNFIENESEEKLRGGYYTPDDIATFLCRWVLSGGARFLLEPSCGDGAFLSALANIAGRSKVNVVGFEIIEKEAAKARRRLAGQSAVTAEVHGTDFLGWVLANFNKCEQFDAVLGNPPFIRYQYWPEPFQRKAEDLFRLLHLPFTKHTNAWVPFVLASIAMLRKGGRLAMVLPAEIIHVMHAQSIRTYLGNTCKRVLLVDPEEIWFEQTLQGAVLLLAEKKADNNEKSEGLAIVRVAGKDFLKQSADDLFDQGRFINGKTIEGKWTWALLRDGELRLIASLREHPKVKQFETIADVDVGLVTGANKFFLVPDEVVEAYQLHRWAHPMFGRSEHCPGVIYDKSQHSENSILGLPTNFIWLNCHADKLPLGARNYIKLGEAQGLHERYKCRVRTPWYEVPSVYTTSVGMLKRCHDFPRLIFNELGAYTTDTAYRIKPKDIDPKKLVHAFINSLTALTAELEGRHYGGGVLELVPSEIERLLVPLPEARSVSLRKLDELVRSRQGGATLVEHDSVTLASIGITGNERARLHEAWGRLRDRRQRITEAEKTLSDFEGEARGSATFSKKLQRLPQKISFRNQRA